MLETVLRRKTIRKYSATPVDEALLNRLLSAACRTQTMGNMQLYSVVVTRDETMRRRLAPAHFNQPMIMGAPVVLTVCADFNRTVRWAGQRRACPGYENFLSFINAATDALLFAQTFCNLAESEGLGICFVGTTIYNPQPIIDVLHLPRLVMPVATLTVGWPAENPQQTDRLPVEAVVHQEYYHDYSPNDIDRFYEAKELLEENKRFVEENGKETLAQVFTDVRYPRRDNEAGSKALTEALKKQGFI